MRIEPKDKFKFLPAIVWCILIDALDFVAGIIPDLLLALGIVPGEGLGILLDIVQAGAVYTVFGDKNAALLVSSEMLLPQSLGDSFFPIVTLTYLLR